MSGGKPSNIQKQFVPLWVAFGILALCFIVFVVIFSVFVFKGAKLLKSARSNMVEKVVNSLARGVVDGVASAISHSTGASA